MPSGGRRPPVGSEHEKRLTLGRQKARMPSGSQTFAELLEAVPDATLGGDASGCVVFANTGAGAALGRALVGESLGELPAAYEVTRAPLGELTLVTLRDASPRTL